MMGDRQGAVAKMAMLDWLAILPTPLADFFKNTSKLEKHPSLNGGDTIDQVYYQAIRSYI